MEIHVVAGSCQNTDRCQRNDGDRQAQSDVKEAASIEKRIEERLPGPPTPRWRGKMPVPTL